MHAKCMKSEVISHRFEIRASDFCQIISGRNQTLPQAILDPFGPRFGPKRLALTLIGNQWLVKVING